MKLAALSAAVGCVSLISAAGAAVQLTNLSTKTETFNSYAGVSTNTAVFDLGASNYTLAIGPAFSGYYNRSLGSYTNNGTFGLRDTSSSTDVAWGGKVAANSGTQSGAGLTTLVLQVQNAATQNIVGFNVSYDIVQLSAGARPTALKFQYRPNTTGAFASAASGATDFAAATSSTEANLSATTTTQKIGVTVSTPVLPTGLAEFRFSIATAGSAGNNGHIGVTNFSFTPIYDNAPPTIAFVLSNSQTVDVSPDGLEGFGPVTVAATDPDVTGSVSTFTLGTIPAQIADNVSITPGVGNTFVITGSGLTYGDLGTYQIPFTATDNLGAVSTSNFTLNVVPEPTSLLLVAAAPALVRRRRR